MIDNKKYGMILPLFVVDSYIPLSSSVPPLVLYSLPLSVLSVLFFLQSDILPSSADGSWRMLKMFDPDLVSAFYGVSQRHLSCLFPKSPMSQLIN